MVIASAFLYAYVACIIMLDNRRNIEVITNKAGRGDQQVAIRVAIAISNLSFVFSRGILMVILKDAPHFCIQILSGNDNVITLLFFLTSMNNHQFVLLIVTSVEEDNVERWKHILLCTAFIEMILSNQEC